MPGGEILGVLPERISGVFSVPGVTASPVDLDGQTTFTHVPFVAAGLVPHLSTHFVQGVGGPLDHVKGIGTAQRLGARSGYDVADPFLSAYRVTCRAA